MTDNQQFQLGEIVDITIKGVRVFDQDRFGRVGITAETPGTDIPGYYQMPPQAAITPVAPANWPPQPGDLWRRTDFAQPDPADDEPDLGLWFAHFDHAIDRGDSRLMLVPAHGDIEYAETNPEKLRASGGRWTLVHREQQVGGESA